jgi:hypothetical protein
MVKIMMQDSRIFLLTIIYITRENVWLEDKIYSIPAPESQFASTHSTNRLNQLNNQTTSCINSFYDFNPINPFNLITLISSRISYLISRIFSFTTSLPLLHHNPHAFTMSRKFWCIKALNGGYTITKAARMGNK